MPLKTNLKSLTPRREAFRKEITLLSRGFSNPKAWPDGKLIVYPWDNHVDEIVLETGRKANTNEMMYAVLAAVCDLNGANVDDFVFSELETVLLVSRAISGGGTIQYKATCPLCRNQTSEEIEVPDELAKVGEKPADYPGYDLITLPECQDVVAIRPLLIRDNKRITAILADQTNALTEHTLRIIMPVVSVNDGRPDTADEVVQWYRALPPKDATFLEESEVNLSPKLDSLIPHACDKCGHQFKQVLSFGREFFR